jgi:hypothetical protein
MKLSTLFVALASLFVVGTASAQFNRVGETGSLALSYVQVNAPNTSSWQGADLTGVIPIGNTKVEGLTIGFNGDVQTQLIQTHSGVTDDQNVGTVGGGVTGYSKFGFDNGAWSLTPYFRAGIQGNSGNFASVNHHYTAYNVEPGVVLGFGSVYALAAYQYGEGFNSEVGSVINMPKVGLGVDLTKNFAIEARYEMNQGSYNFNRTVAGVTYKF